MKYNILINVGINQKNILKEVSLKHLINPITQFRIRADIEQTQKHIKQFRKLRKELELKNSIELQKRLD